ncbi:MAG: hypothetical protein CENE_02783 [Candidatus Celerinatantimonas neptuna]|nr:MAG: hypothetical protein CENE_02783 [Candidatus Celerinatantimonas neptuna]
MVSIVIVSHSKLLAEGLYTLASQMTQGKVNMAVAAGIDDPENPIGTDPIAVMNAIEAVYSPDGVLVLVDMGSAILSTDMALELLDDDKANAVKVCAAPLVEGTMVAGVSAASGLSLEQVLHETHRAIIAKYETLEQTSALPLATGTDTDPQEAPADDRAQYQFSWQVKNPHGIHARPAAAIVTMANQFTADMKLTKGERQASAKSINKIALLGVKQNDTITCTTQGSDARQAIEAFSELAQSHFGEDIAQTTPIAVQLPLNTKRSPANRPRIQDGAKLGIAASDGLAIAPAVKLKATIPDYPKRSFTTFQTEINRFKDAIGQSCFELDQLIKKMDGKVSSNELEIFKAHQQMLTDPELTKQVEALIHRQIIAEQAWTTVIKETAEAYQASTDSYLTQRAHDIYDIGRRVMQSLTGQQHSPLSFSEPVILLASDLSPSDTAQLDPDLVKGICLEKGGSTSHCAILARSLGIPAVMGVCELLKHHREGQRVILDGTQGKIWLSPDKAQLHEYQNKLDEHQRQLEQEQAEAALPAVTRDGQSIEIVANIANREDARLALSRQAQGVGLLRSEFLFMDMNKAPTEEEQTRFYSDIAASFHDHPVIVRTLDIGGDKPLPYLQQRTEDNPFLGCRGIRLCLENPDVFKVQLRALLRSFAEHNNLQIMFPMISCVEELLAAKSLLQEAQSELLTSGLQCALPKVGIMIEIPSAVANAKALAQHADFFSIGTNDLTQYVMAADRGNESVAHLISTQQPAVLSMIKTAIDAAHQAGIKIGICGEMAGDARLTPYLIGLGVDELSMSSIRIAAVKSAVRNTHFNQASQAAEQLLKASTLKEVQALIK